jgi:23S rRNA (cytosine1962-C5)-methyltransferase
MPRDDGPSRRGGRPARRPRSEAPIVRRGTLKLSHEVSRRVRLGHPWVYREALDTRRSFREEPGAVVELVDWDGEFVGRGIFDGETAIAVRVMTRDRRRAIDSALVADRVRSAVALRQRFFDFEREQVLRLVNAENDGLPAIAVDRYGDYLVVQLYSSAVTGLAEALYDALEQQLSPKAIYLQQRFKPLSGEAPRGAAELVRGVPAPVELEVREGELHFAVDVTAPLSTGLFPDLRDGRRVVARWAKGRRVLNLFSYTGAITVYAVWGGATEVAAVDVAPKAHARARRNLGLSKLDAEKPDYIVGDAFKVLAKMAERGRQFDVVVLDPPAFASAQKGGKAWSANQNYGELVEAALRVLAPGGALIAASSTHKLSQEAFDLALAEGAVRAETELRIVERAGLPVDFPVAPGFPEGNYLKFAVAIRD